MKLRNINRLFLLLTVSVSCVDEVYESSDIEREISIQVSSQDTKTSGITEIVFDEGDCLSLFDGQGNNCLFEQDNAQTGSFIGKIHGDGAPTYAVYPYCESASVVDGKISTVFPKHFEAIRSNSVICGMNLSVGEIIYSNAAYSATLKNVCGIVGVNIPEEVIGVSNVRLISKEGKALSGRVLLDYNGGQPVVCSVESGEPSVDFDIASDSKNKAEAGKYYFSILPGIYKGVRLEVTLLSGSVYSFESENTLVVERSKRTFLKDIELSDVQHAPTSSMSLEIAFPASEDGSYCPTLYKKEGQTISYLPPYGAGNYDGNTYYFEQDGFEYPIYISSDNAAGTLHHCWWKSKSGLMFSGGAKDAYIMVPTVAGKKLSAISMATNGSVRRTIRIADYPDGNADALQSGRYVEGKSGANDQLGTSIDVSALSRIGGQPIYIYFAHDAITISRIVLEYEECGNLPEIPEYYTDYIAEKTSEVSALQRELADGFIFWTDTHVSANSMNSPALINRIASVSSDPKVFWGGDAIPAYTADAPGQWLIQKGLHESIASHVKIFNVHGNHDITAKNSKDSSQGYTMSKDGVKDCFIGVMSTDIVRNSLDENGLYYYYDQTSAKVRYIVMDLYENYTEENIPWGVTSGVSDTQMEWIFNEAVLNAPEGYKLFFLMHNSVGFYRNDPMFKNLYDALLALSSHSSSQSYDFSIREDLSLLMVLGGHAHHDMQIGLGGVFYVQTASDACYEDFKRSPFADSSIQRTSGSIYEQAFDFVGISDDYETITMLRIGVGGYRRYHLKPIQMVPGDKLKLESDNAVKWFCYDSESRYESSTWTLYSDVATISADGTVTAAAPGDAVVAAMDDDHNLELFYISVSEETFVNLSDKGTANCYIVTEPGRYRFDASVKGCGRESVGAVATAHVLWETFGSSVSITSGELINNVSYRDGYVTFSTPDNFKNGNALVAVKDATGNVLWSWHIWCVSDGIQEIEYARGAGIMMDRNLGATRASANTYTSYGLLYQWGRKDPFLGSSNISQPIEPQNTLESFHEVPSSEGGTVSYSVAHPTTFILEESSSGDWLQQADNSLWSTVKTIYDPCPFGWKVPYGGDLNVWATANDSPMIFNGTWSTYYGMNFKTHFGTSVTTWYPAAGYRKGLDGELCDVGSAGFYWSTAPSADAVAGFMFSSSSNVLPIYYGKADACSVRCIKE